MNRSKVTRVNDLEKEVLLSAKAEKVEMTLNTSNAIASGLLIQRLTELYENPVEATVRETVSNALDAVSERFAGKRPEIRITVPTSLHPVLIIKDNGIGMTYDDLKEIYSKYGSSTKMDNLETIGAYGLGAKSPLAYGTEFTVTSVKDGQKTTIIVAREELTNYIKIVSSVETDEPSGTTVAVPVSNRDINKFAEYVEIYKTVPMDRDVDLYINSELMNEKGLTVITDKLVTYKNSSETVFGRVWINLKQAIEILEIGDYSIKRQIKFIIGGWSYSTPEGRSRNYYNSSENLIYVELKPGIVGFNSSRDAILENDRYYELENLVIDYIKSEQFATDLVKQVNGMELNDFKQITSRLLADFKRSIQIINGEIVINQANSGKNRTIKFSELTHKETGFNINHILKGVPKKQLPTFVFQEEKVRHYKTSRSAVMTEELSSYNIFENETITSLNKSIDDVLLTEEEDGQNLNNLMVNMTSLIHSFKERMDQVKITLVTDIKNEEQIKKLKTGRRNLVKMRNDGDELTNYKSILIYTKHSKSEMKKMIKVIEMNELDIKTEVADTIIQEIDAYKAANKVIREKTERKMGLSTSFIKYGDKGSEYNAEIKDIDNSLTNFVIVTKSGINNNRLKMMLAWFCNKTGLNANQVQMYVSSGMHTVIDLNVLKDNFGTNIYRDPNSDNAGISNMYYNEIHDNVAELNAVRNDSVNTSEKAFMRLITGVYTGNPTSLISNLKDKIEYLNQIAEAINYDLPKLTDNKVTEFMNFDTDIFGDLRYSSDWELSSSALTHLSSLVNQEHLELAQNILILAGNRTFSMYNNEVVTDYNSYSIPSLSKIKEVYEGKTGSTTKEKMIKSTIVAYMDFVKETINQLLLLNL